MDATNLADLYDLPLLDWSQIQARLEEGVTQMPESGGPNRHTWLNTINADGSPHALRNPARSSFPEKRENPRMNPGGSANDRSQTS
jgi:hypothetical protein